MRAYRYNPVHWHEWLPGVAGSVVSFALSLLLVGWLKPQGTTRWVVMGLVAAAGYLCLRNIAEAVVLLMRSRRAGVWTDAEGFVVANWFGRKERVAWADVVSVANVSGRVQVVWQSRHWRPKTLEVGTREMEDAFDLIREIAERTGKPVASDAPPAGFVPLGEISLNWKPEKERKQDE
jgi:hypothetical protein